MTCPICGGEILSVKDYNQPHRLYECQSCGKFLLNEHPLFGIMSPQHIQIQDKDRLASYLYYNGKVSNPLHAPQACFCNVISSYDFYQTLSIDGLVLYWVSKEVVDNWYPRTFNEKVDLFLLMLNQRSFYLGDKVLLSEQECMSACFAVREIEGYTKHIEKPTIQCFKFFKYLSDRGFIDYSHNHFELLPEGLKRVDDYQSTRAIETKEVFVAMSFAEEMAETRAAIKNAIINTGFIPIIMDEVEHNHQIVPEMLHKIRQARFVIAELTNHNNGAYFEAGYALGKGKEVIQLCKKESFSNDCHFDVKQVNTVLWDDSKDLEIKLENRIKATIF